MRPRRTVRAIAALVVFLAALALLPDARAATPRSGLLSPSNRDAGHAAVVDAGSGIDVESTCGTETSPVGQLPDPSGVGLVGDPFVIPDGLDASGPRLLRVYVLLDGVTREEAHRIIRGARRDYDPLGVQLRLVRTVSTRFATTEATGIIAKARQLLGGRRPTGSDIVLVLTDKDIRAAGQRAVAGLADCIGGVAHADRAFAVAEARVGQDTRLAGPVFIDIDARTLVTAHEIGHLMGGQHHYANCAEGVGGPGDEVHVERRRLEVTPCTLMFNAANFIGHGFGTVNGTIVRGTASHHLPRA